MKMLNGAFKWIFDMGNWLFKLMYLHVLWVAFTLLGVIFLGFFPATAGVYTVTRKWVEGDPDVPIFRTFFDVYKSIFVQINGLGYVMAFVGAFLTYDFIISKQLVGSFFIHVFLLLFSVLFILVLCYLFPVYVRYDLRFFQYFKQTFLIVVSRPLESVGMIVCLLLLYYLFIILPVLFVLAGSSIIAFLMMGLAYRAFAKIEQRKMDEG